MACFMGSRAKGSEILQTYVHAAPDGRGVQFDLSCGRDRLNIN